MYIADDGEIYKMAGEIAPCDEFSSKWKEGPKFKEDKWARYTIEDTVDWEAENTKWEERQKQWWAPFNWANYGD